jgi:hypothetical protein
MADTKRTALGSILLLTMLAACSPTHIPRSDSTLNAQRLCRVTARHVFSDIMKKRLTIAQGQAEVDEACVDVEATERKTILDSERVKALVEYGGTVSTSPNPKPTSFTIAD